MLVDANGSDILKKEITIITSGDKSFMLYYNGTTKPYDFETKKDCNKAKGTITKQFKDEGYKITNDRLN